MGMLSMIFLLLLLLLSLLLSVYDVNTRIKLPLMQVGAPSLSFLSLLTILVTILGSGSSQLTPSLVNTNVLILKSQARVFGNPGRMSTAWCSNRQGIVDASTNILVDA